MPVTMPATRRLNFVNFTLMVMVCKYYKDSKECMLEVQNLSYPSALLLILIMPFFMKEMDARSGSNPQS
jgi:hypothetical protein